VKKRENLKRVIQPCLSDCRIDQARTTLGAVGSGSPSSDFAFYWRRQTKEFGWGNTIFNTLLNPFFADSGSARFFKISGKGLSSWPSRKDRHP
jgi:hypothetical protein